MDVPQATGWGSGLSDETKLGALNVNMSNTLVTAAHGLSLAEKRVVSAAVAKVDTFNKRNGGLKDGLVRIAAADYAETYGLDSVTAYEQLQAAGDRIFGRHIRIVRETPRGLKETKFRWVSSATYHHGEGWIELRFTPEIAPHLVGLKSQFTTYALNQASALRSIYSWRLLELLSQFESTGWRQMGIDDLHHALETPDGYRSNFAQMRRWIIEPAVRELTEKDGWIIAWEPIKSGRKVTALKFVFRRNPQGQLQL
ncbi:replication initiation protein [Gulbenkiania mobilis]|uniref:replication initiation protein n=1 Tax=Gulbenkiania mobilis TaxID=397457 RepID=UPI0006BBDB61|nr:replication initiation protein [Gulbenkiania mobilis]